MSQSNHIFDEVSVSQLTAILVDAAFFIDLHKDDISQSDRFRILSQLNILQSTLVSIVDFADEIRRVSQLP